MEYDMKLILDKTYGKGEKILLETKRLILRELTYDDFKPLYAVLGDSDMTREAYVISITFFLLILKGMLLFKKSNLSR